MRCVKLRLVLISSLLIALGLFAQVPKTINYQGKLTNSAGVAVHAPSGIPLTFSIYNTATGGTALWTEAHGSVAVTNGLFDVILGETTALNLPFNAQYWMQLTVNGEILTPREKLTSVAYAHRAVHADTAYIIGSGAVLTTARIDGDGTVGNELDIARQGASSGQVLKWNGTSWAPANDDVGTSSSNWTVESSYIRPTLCAESFYIYDGMGSGRNQLQYISAANNTDGKQLLRAYNTSTSSCASGRNNAIFAETGVYTGSGGSWAYGRSSGAILGYNNSTNGTYSYGVAGFHYGNTANTPHAAVFGGTNITGSTAVPLTYGAIGYQASSSAAYGIFGASTWGGLASYGGYFTATGGGATTNYGLYAYASNATNNYSGYFDGGVIHIPSFTSSTGLTTGDGNMFWNSSTDKLYVHNGTTWQEIGESTGGLTGSGTATQIAFWNTSSSLSSDADLYWNNTTKRLSIGAGSSPTSRLQTSVSGAVTTNTTANYFANTATSSTASLQKVGLFIESSGTWNGSSSTNVGLDVLATNGTTNYGIRSRNAIFGTSLPSGFWSGVFEGDFYVSTKVGIGTYDLTAPLTIRNTSLGQGAWSSGFRPQIMATNTDPTAGSEVGIGLQTGSSDDELGSGWGVILRSKLNTYVLGITGGTGVVYSRFNPDPASASNGAFFPGNATQTSYLTKGNSANEITFANSGGDYNAVEVGIGTYAPAQQLHITRNFRLPATTSTTGIIYADTYTLLHSYGTASLYVGTSAGNLTSTGLGMNTGIGYQAMGRITNGTGNTGIGTSVMNFTTSGSNNTAIGYSALSSNETGGANVATGRSALGLNTLGSYNTGVGDLALWANQANSRSTAMGYKAMYNADNRTTGRSTYNTAIGCEALHGSITPANNTGQYNTAVGDQAMYSNTSAYGNTAVGYHALYANQIGVSNSAFGNQALESLNPPGAAPQGFYNTAIGYRSMQTLSTGWGNTAIGYYSLQLGSSSAKNTAVGYEALIATTSDGNTSVGYQALKANTTGSANTAVGNSALASVTTSWFNTAMGDSSLAVSTGLGNTAYGAASMIRTTSGGGNAAFGMNAMFGNTTGQYNTACGGAALNINQTGSYNTAVGNTAGPAVGFSGLSNTSALGYNANPTITNRIHIGNTSVSWIGGQVSWSTYSDERAKSDVRQDIHGLDFIGKLRPVSYSWDKDALDKLMGVTDSAQFDEKYDIEKMRISGFLAQEVERAAMECGYDFSGVDNASGVYSLSYAQFVVPLVKAVQEQQAMIQEQNALIEELKNRIEALESK